MTIYKELAALLLPEGLLTYYDLIDFKKSDDILQFHQEEKKEIPDEYKKEVIGLMVFYQRLLSTTFQFLSSKLN